MAALYDVIVKSRHVEGENIAVIEFASALDQKLPSFEAGAHIDVHLPNGLIRQYSLCQNPTINQSYRLGVLKDPASRGGSLAVFETLLEGMNVQISEPKNLFPLAEAPHSVLVGGGIGITPLITMAYQLYARGESFELHYCGSSSERCAFVDEIKQGVLSQFTVFHFKSEGANHRENLEQIFNQLDTQSHVYTCGPNGFMEWIIHLAELRQLPPQNIHREYFQVEIETSGKAFEVVAKQSGKVILVNEQETILQALAREGIQIEMSCEQGVCGTCMCDVLEGEPDHRDVYLTDEEKQSNEQILVCCSRSKSAKLVLDI